VSHIDPDMIALIALGESALPRDLEHVRNCVQCQSEVDEFTAIATSARAIGAADRPIAPPAQVWDRIEAELGMQLPVVPTHVETKTRAKSRVMFALAASVGVLVGGLGTYIAVSTDSSDSRATIVAQASLDPLRDVKSPLKLPFSRLMAAKC